MAFWKTLNPGCTVWSDKGGHLPPRRRIHLKFCLLSGMGMTERDDRKLPHCGSFDQLQHLVHLHQMLDLPRTL